MSEVKAERPTEPKQNRFGRTYTCLCLSLAMQTPSTQGKPAEQLTVLPAWWVIMDGMDHQVRGMMDGWMDGGSYTPHPHNWVDLGILL